LGRGVPGSVRRTQEREENEHEPGTASVMLRVGRPARAFVVQALRPALWLALATAPLLAQSQSTELHTKFKSGQGVVPVYEGWERVPDGSFNMVFGYLNRNHVEELAVSVGAQNGFDPGPA